MEFCKRIKQLRQEKGLLQKDLAKLLNVRNTTISSWEVGDCEPDIKTIKELTQIFEVSAGYLLGLED